MQPLHVSHPATGLRRSTPSPDAPELLQFVDFKWLMVGEGHCVDLDRLQHDRAYHRGCLALAAGSRSATLRRAAERLASAVCAPDS